MQCLRQDEIEFQIQKYLTHLVKNFSNLKRKKIEEEIVELNNLFEEFENDRRKNFQRKN